MGEREEKKGRRGERSHVRMCEARWRETERMLEAVFRWRGRGRESERGRERRMGSRWRGRKKV